MIPLSDGIAARRFPIVNVALIAANFAVFLFYELPNPAAAVSQAPFYPCDVNGSCHMVLILRADHRGAAQREDVLDRCWVGGSGRTSRRCRRRSAAGAASQVRGGCIGPRCGAASGGG
jgi:hypothetical protein